MPKPNKIIAVAGGSCSGKTTLLNNLAAQLGKDVVIFPFDEMFVSFASLRGKKITDWESPDLYRWDEFLRCISELKQGRPVTMQGGGSRDNDEAILMFHIEPRPILMVEGFLVLHDPRLRALYDTTMFIDLSEEEILRRRKAQANPEIPMDSDEYLDKFLIPGHRKYVKPQRKFAHHILDGMLPREELMREAMQFIRPRQIVTVGSSDRPGFLRP